MINLKQISSREKIIIAATCTIIFLALAFNFILGPILDKIGQSDKEIEQKTAHLKRYSGLMSQSGDLASLYTNYKDILEKDLDPQELTENLFKEVERLAKTRGLNIKRIKPLGSGKKKEYKDIALEVELEGNFKSIFQFVNDLENSTSLIKAEGIRFMPQTQAQGQLNCRLSLAKIFF